MKGKMLIWKFRPDHRAYRGWNLTADAPACEAMQALLEQIEGASPGDRHRLDLSPASNKQVKSLTGSKPDAWAQVILLEYRQEEPRLWITGEKEETLHLIFGKREMDLLQTAFFRIRKGESNFAIGDENDEQLLYFWAYQE